MDSWIWNALLYVIGTGAFLTSYLAFSPVTRDLVVFLSRNAEIQIFRYRKLLWALGAICLGLLALKSVSDLAGMEVIGTAHLGWLILTAVTTCGLGFVFWATYVPVVMAPPAEHRTVAKDEADSFLRDESVVLGLDMGDRVRAYPRDLIARPHWFNDEMDGKPIMISYCILCNSGQAFVPMLKNGKRLNLRNMTAYDNNTIYADESTGNYIQQLEGKVIAGPDAGEELERYPVMMARWGDWKRLYPDTTVYYAPPRTLRDRTVQKMLETMIPIERLTKRAKPWHLLTKPLDSRLPAMSFVFGINIADESCAIPLKAAEEHSVIQDTVGGEPLVVFFDQEYGIGQVFSRRLEGKILSFEPYSGDQTGILACDRETSSFWGVRGQAEKGPLSGKRLDILPHYNQLFWFSWAAFFPETRINDGAAHDDTYKDRQERRVTAE